MQKITEDKQTKLYDSPPTITDATITSSLASSSYSSLPEPLAHEIPLTTVVDAIGGAPSLLPFSSKSVTAVTTTGVATTSGIAKIAALSAFVEEGRELVWANEDVQLSHAGTVCVSGLREELLVEEVVQEATGVEVLLLPMLAMSGGNRGTAGNSRLSFSGKSI